jgi:hypothetical protein
MKATSSVRASSSAASRKPIGAITPACERLVVTAAEAVAIAITHKVSFRMASSLGRSGKPKIVHDHSVRPDWHLTGIRQIELAKHNLVACNLEKEVFEDLDC